MDEVLSTWFSLSTSRQLAIIGTLLGTLAIITLQVATRSVRPTNAVLLLFFLTLLMAQTFGFWSGLLWALISDSILIFFFFEPIFRFWAHDTQLQVTLGMFLAASVLAGFLPRDRGAFRAAKGSGQELAPEAAFPVAKAWSTVMEEEAQPTPAPVLQILTTERTVTLNGCPVSLTPTEFSLLQHFASNPGRVLTHRSILASVWGEGYSEDSQILRTFVKQLRAKLGEDSNNPRFLRTEARVGYRFTP